MRRKKINGFIFEENNNGTIPRYTVYEEKDESGIVFWVESKKDAEYIINRINDEFPDFTYSD